MPARAFERALVIRGGALGDFLLTLPVLNSLRVGGARVGLLAYPSFAALARSAGLADDARSIEYGPLAGFFARDAAQDPALREYFASHDLVLSYLYDPDGIFAENLQKAGVRRFLTGQPKISGSSHAIDQLAVPLTELGLELATRAVRLDIPSAPSGGPVIALHPGSGSPAKNWPAGHWKEVIGDLLAAESDTRVAVVGGEADRDVLRSMRSGCTSERMLWWENLPLTELAERLAGSIMYLGHDTGVSHLAAATGTPSLLLFGPTDPGVWAPPHEHVRVIRAPEANLGLLPPSSVLAAARRLLASARLASRARPSQSSSL
ncbi:MAG: glycosyltransferase family 9 protein [Chthoniobacterales bacterium]|nr:glycosyltransferase family 9 protein [Chthoniobacterales bacterium]